MQKKTFLPLLLFLAGTASEIRSQTETLVYRTPAVFPPSPNAIALGRYGDIPVSEYTGVPNIDIPLHTLTEGTLSLPLSISYHASGIRVIQEASSVGLGWVLNAGGCITRTIRGRDDLTGANGSASDLDTYPMPPHDQNNLPDWQGMNRQEQVNSMAYYKNAAAGSYDSEPDIFFYNFAGRAGKFIVPKLQTGGMELKKTGLMIRCDDGDHWEAMDEKGNVYYFNTTEIMTNLRAESLWTDPAMVYRAKNISGPHDDPVTYYLDSIRSPQGDRILFRYSDRYVLKSQLQFYQEYRTINSLYDLPRKLDFTSMQEHRIRNLEEIIAGPQRIRLEYALREDLFLADPTQPARLKKMHVIGGNDTLKTIVFYNDRYFENGNGLPAYLHKRLRLDSLSVRAGALTVPPYVFEYDPTELPEKTSYNVDHWGYYNQSHNTTLLPRIRYQEEKPYLEGGADRSSRPTGIRAAILNKITYPTGGSSEFTYGAHTYRRQDLSDYIESGLEVVRTIETRLGTQTFSLDQNCIMTVYHSFRTEDDKLMLSSMEARIVRTGGPSIPNPDAWKYAQRLGAPERMEWDTTFTLILPPGDYHVWFNTDPREFDQFILFSYRSEETPEEGQEAPPLQGGGLRIEKIVHRDRDGAVTEQKTYAYDTGVLINPVEYYYTDEILGGFQSCFIDPFDALTSGYDDIMARWGDNHFSVLTSGNIDNDCLGSGNIVGYRTVSVSDENGTIRKTFRCEPNAVPDVRLPGMPLNERNDNGLCTEIKYLDENGETVRTVARTYRQRDKEIRKGIQIYVTPVKYRGVIWIPALPTGEGILNVYYPKYYDIVSDRWEETGQTQIDHMPAGNILTVTEYEYNDKYQQTSVTVTDSEGKRVTDRTVYPCDISEGIYPAMTRKNMLDYPVEAIRTVDDRIASATLCTYSEANFLPEAWYRLETDIPQPSFTPFDGNTKDSRYEPVPQTRILQRDKRGNIRETIDKTGTHTVFLWGYGSRYLIAKIENASWEQVTAVLPAATLDELADPAFPDDATLRETLVPLRAGLPASSVAVYTHAPAIGVSSMTDPSGRTTHYRYDALGRLKTVVDETGHMLETYDYHYQR